MFLDVINSVIDTLIKGLGVESAISAATVYAPWLSLPVISWLFRQLVEAVASRIDAGLKTEIDNIIIRVQNDIRKGAYDDAIEKIKNPGASEEDLEAARRAIDALVRR